MSRKHFSWLLFITIVVTAAVVLMPGRTGKESTLDKTMLLPDMEALVNDVDWLRVTAPGGLGVATLQRGDQGWAVAEASGYRADWERLRALLSDLAQAEVVEQKTANPEYYGRLGVGDVDDEEAGGSLIEFADSTGLPALIVGNNASGREGQYARLRDSAESVLIDRRFDVPAEPNGWLDREIIDVSDAEAVEFSIVHPDGETVKAMKPSADDENFSLSDIPEGQEIKSAWTVNSLANVLASLNLEAVAPAETVDWSNPIRFSLLTADGLLVEVDLVPRGGDDDEKAEQEFWIRLAASIYTTALDSAVEVPDDSSETASRADGINGRTAGWAYRILQYKYESMTKRMADLVEDIESS